MTDADNVVAGSSGGLDRAYLRNMFTGATAMVSVDSVGNYQEGLAPQISRDGGWVGFTAPDAAAGGTQELFLHRIVNGQP